MIPVKNLFQYTTAVGYMSHNGRQLGEVADWELRTLEYHKRSRGANSFGFHPDRYFAKLLVI